MHKGYRPELSRRDVTHEEVSEDGLRHEVHNAFFGPLPDQKRQRKRWNELIGFGKVARYLERYSF